MQLPSPLRRAIEAETVRNTSQALVQAAVELSENYRSRSSARADFIPSELHRLAYAIVRMPATFASAHAVLSEVCRRMPDAEIRGLLDLGTGPGGVAWAANEVFGGLEQVTLYERDEGWIRMGKSLARAGANPLLEKADWVRADLRAAASFPVHDLVVCSYSLGETEQEASRDILRKAWAATRSALVVIEPGTMPGFHLIRKLREDLVDLGGSLVAPCPHQGGCPIPDNDWCHFSRRFERSPLHRRLKGGALGYEDEKFAYVAASKVQANPAHARVIRHPLRHAGHIHMQLCEQGEIRTLTVTRSDKPNWRRAKKTDWGDAWPDLDPREADAAVCPVP